MRALLLLEMAVLTSLLSLGECTAQPAAADLYHDFRGKHLPGEWKLFGDLKEADLNSGPEGLRITLPKGRKKALRGLSLPVSVRGDAEITATFEILHADVPSTGYGSGVILAINQVARVASVVEPGGKWGVRWDRFKVEGKAKLGPLFEREAKAGKLRLRRVGPTLHFEWAPGINGDQFEEIHQCEFGLADITLVRLIPSLGDPQSSLDVRFIDFLIHSDRPASDAEVIVPRVSGDRWWVVLAVVIFLGILLSSWGWLAFRQRRRRA